MTVHSGALVPRAALIFLCITLIGCGKADRDDDTAEDLASEVGSDTSFDTEEDTEPDLSSDVAPETDMPDLGACRA